MNQPKLTNYHSYKELLEHSKKMVKKKYHLKNLIQHPDRLNQFSIPIDNFFYDFSKQRVDEAILEKLVQLAREAKAKDEFLKMISGEIINVTENRAVLHTATRDFTKTPIFLDGVDIKLEINRVNEQIKKFSSKIVIYQYKLMESKNSFSKNCL